MKRNSVRASFAALLAATSMIAFQAMAADDTGPKVSKAVAGPLGDAQKLMQANDFKDAIDKIKAAQATPGLTDDDNYVINEFLANAAIGMKDYATADTAYEAMAASPTLDKDPNKASTLRNALILAASVKRWPQSVQIGEKLAALGPMDGPATAALVQAYYFSNDYAHAQAMAQKSIDAAKAAGQMPDRGVLQIMMNSEANAKNEAAAEATLEELALDYGQPDDWGQLLDIVMGTKGLRDIDALYITRLRTLTGANGKEDDFVLAANIAMQLGFPGEARNDLEQGMNKGVVGAGGKAGALLANARSKAAADEKSISAQEAMGAKQSGEYNVKLAEADYGYGRYPQAEEAARRAISKGGLKDPSEGQMVLGQALVQQGKYADAVSAFQAVSGGGPATARIAKLWADYAQHKGSAGAQAATAAPGGAK